MKNDCDCLFFDVDGTLIDASIDIANAVNQALSLLGRPKLSKDVIMSYVGSGVKDLLAKSMGINDTAMIDKATDIYSEHYIQHASDETVLYPNVIEILEYFNNKRKFILTNRYALFADAALKGLGIRDYFEDIIGSDDGDCVKPNACIVDNVVERLGVDKSRSLIIGDMDVDVLTGKNAGIKTCWITHGLGRHEDVLALKPDYVIDDLIELKDIVSL